MVEDKLYIAWAAGFFEGEGCFYIHKDKPRHNGTRKLRLYASMCQKGEEGKVLLIKFKNIVHAGKVYKDGVDMYIWKTTIDREVDHVFKLLHEFLGSRRTRTFMKLKQQVINQPKHIKQKKLICNMGHIMSIAGQRKDGTCIICNREYQRNWYHKKKKLTDIEKHVNLNKSIKENGDV